MIDGYQSMKVMNLNFTVPSVDLSEFEAKKKNSSTIFDFVDNMIMCLRKTHNMCVVM